MFSNQNIKNYILPFAVIFGVSMFSDKIKEYLQTDSDRDDYYLVRKYLLNDVNYIGVKSKPIMWIYSNFELNARKWSSFNNRTNTELNQPYLLECIQSIIDKCGDKFNICLIDDESFSKLLPQWGTDVSKMMGKEKQKFVQLGILKLIYKYGGVNVPNSLLCINNLDTIYNYLLNDEVPFFFEKINDNCNSLSVDNMSPFTPSINMYGSTKNNGTIKEIIDFAEVEIINKHANSAYDFEGYISNFLSHLKLEDKIMVFDGVYIGIKTDDGNQILIEDLLSETRLPISPDSFGILIPADKILNRSKYNWFSVSNMNDIYNSNLIIGDYFKHIKTQSEN